MYTPFKWALLLGSLVALLFTSCETDISFDKKAAPPADAPLGNAVNSMLVGLLDLSQQADFRTLVHEEVAKQFDGDDNVLLRTLLLARPSLAQEMAQSVEYWQDKLPRHTHAYSNYAVEATQPEALQALLRGVEWGDATYYLQIYVPFVDEVDLSAQPVLCFGHQEVETTLGYQRTAKGTWQARVIDESFARKNLVWVISINEVVDERGMLPQTEIPTATQARSLGRSVEVSEVKIDDRKETWIKGKAEVALAAAVLKSNCEYKRILPIGYIVKIGENKVGEWCNVNPGNNNTVIFATGYPYDPLADDERITMLMFEKDVHGARDYRPCSAVSPINYKSQNIPYGSVTRTANSLNSTTSLKTKTITPWSDKGIRVKHRIWY